MKKHKLEGEGVNKQHNGAYSLDKYQQIPVSYFETLSREELSERLKAFVLDLLLHDFNRLCNLIYRHDVAETKFNKALSYHDIEEQAIAIADLIIEREMEKIASRRAYQQHKKNRQKPMVDDEGVG